MHPKKNTLLAIIAVVLLFNTTQRIQAQDVRKTISGLCVDSLTKQPVRFTSIININTGIKSLANSYGLLEMTAIAGQLLAFTANGYLSDTIRINEKQVANGNIILVLKQLSATLPNVTVTNGFNQYQLDSIARRTNFLQNTGSAKIPIVSHTNDLGFGVGINIDHWSSKQKNKRKARTLWEIMEEDAYINSRWNENLIEKFTLYRGDSLYTFLQHHRPTNEWLRKHPTEEDLMYYINSLLKKQKGTHSPKH